jgi:outer membrane protein, heavy metal efflux system
MRSIIRAAAIVVSFTIARPAAAQELPAPTRYLDPAAGLSIGQAIAEGLRQAPGLREARTDIDAARGERRQADLRPNPMVSGERREEVGGGDNVTAVSVELPLDLFRREARLAVADRGVIVAERSADDRARLLAADIRDRIGVILAAVRRLQVLDGLVAASRRTVDLLTSRVSEGAAPPLDRDMAIVDVERLRATRELAIGQADAAVAELRPLLGLPPQSPLKLRESLETAVAADQPDGTAARAVDRRPDLLVAEAEVAVAEARVTQLQQEAKPDLGVFGSYMRMDSNFPQTAFASGGALEPIHGIFHNLAAGVKVTVPVFNRNQGAVAAAKARVEGATHLAAARQLAVGSEIEAARARDTAARRAVAVYSADTLGLARRNLEVIRETYQLGRATLFDVLNEQRRYLDFEGAYTDALAEAFTARTALQRATGVIR